VNKKRGNRKNGQAKVLDGPRKVVLATSLRALVLQLTVDDECDGEPVRHFPREKTHTLWHDLSPDEKKAQEDTASV
jgi:hypothetical protein